MKDIGDTSAAGSVSAGADMLASFREHESVLIRFIAARVGCRATAEDLAQEVFVRLDRARWAVVNPRAFLFRMAANLVINHKQQARRRIELTDDVKGVLWSEVDEATPERHALAREELQRVWSGMQHLPDRTLQILIWTRFDGLNRSEIGRRLGISGNAVEKHLRSAMLRLAEAAESEKK